MCLFELDKIKTVLWKNTGKLESRLLASFRYKELFA